MPWRAVSDESLLVGKAHTKATARRSRTPGAVSANAVRLWTRKRLRPVTRQRLHREDVTLYTLRHTHASLCHYVGMTVPEAARRLGHSPALHVATYAHVIDGLQGQRFDGFDALIAAARAELGLRADAAVARRLRDR